MKNSLLAAVLVLSALSFGFTADNNGSEKITICHKPPGNPDNCHEITIGISALQAHLDHGDDLVCNTVEEYNIAVATLSAYRITSNKIIKKY